MSAMRTRPVPKTSALGGVPTGIMNARLLESVAGNISMAGLDLFAAAAAARIGIRMFDVAVLLVNSEKKVTATQSTASTASVGQSRSMPTRSPIDVDRPDASNALAMAMPPPNSISTPQGICLAVGQSRSRLPSPAPLGNEEQDDDGDERDGRVAGFVRTPTSRRPAAVRNLARDPGERGEAEHGEHALLRDGPLAFGFHFDARHAAEFPGEHEPGDGEHQHRDDAAHEQPLVKRHGGAGGRFVGGEKDAVGRSADRRGDAADARAVGDAQEQRHAELARCRRTRGRPSPRAASSARRPCWRPTC